MSRFARAIAFVATLFKKHRRILLPVFGVALLGVIGWTQSAHAISVDDVSTWTMLTNPLDTIMVLLAALFNAIASGVGWMIITLIKVILIPILNYDGFSTSRIITLGWSLVRDVVNMFVVIILLVIAVLTIVGSPRANWEQQIPRLFIYVIAVNFSRTICGLLLDLGNVIMFQFVNAILDVGAGNFAQLLRLNVSGSFSDLNGEATKAFQLLASAYLQLALLLAILAVIGIMVLVFLYRIVVLWVLIIMSPAAFFLGGIKDVLGQAGSAYSEWWKKFSSAIILGPMLTFFLWLALAAASTGDIVSSENFPVGEVETTAGLLLKAFDMSQITGLLLGLVLLVVGMQQAAGAAGALGGVAAQFINEGMGMRIAKGAIRMPAREMARQVDRRTGIGMKTGKALIGAGAKLGDVPLLGRGLRNAGGALQKLSHDSEHAAMHNAEERVKGWTDDRLATELELAADGNSSALLSNTDDQNFALKRLVTDKDLQEKMEIRMGKERYENFMRNAIKHVEDNEKHILGEDEAAGKNFHKTKTRNVHLISAMKGADGVEKSAAERQRAHLDSDKTDLRDLSKDAIKDEGVRANLATITREEDGKIISKLDDVEAGKFGDKLKNAALEAPNASTRRPSSDYASRNRTATLSVKSSEDIRVAVAGGDLQLSSAGGADGVKGSDFSGTRTYTDEHGVTHTESVGQNLAKAIAFSGRDLTLPSNDMDAGAKAQFDMHISDVINDTSTTVGDRKKAIVARYLVGKDASRFTFAGAHAGEELEALQDIVKADPSALRHFAGAAATDTNVQNAIEKAVNQNILTKMKLEAKRYAKTDPRYAEIQASVAAMRTALQAITTSGARVPDSVRNKARAVASLESELS